jgi:hypothetical protein
MKNQKITVSKEFYEEVESTTMLLYKLNYPLDLLDDLYKIHLPKKQKNEK